VFCPTFDYVVKAEQLMTVPISLHNSHKRTVGLNTQVGPKSFHQSKVFAIEAVIMETMT
jgi:hypothetical protein